MIDDERMDRYRDEIEDDEAIETTFRRLRREGHSRLEAVRILLGVLDLSLAEAKEVLLRSDTWADAFDETSAASPNADAAGDEPPSDVPPAPG